MCQSNLISFRNIGSKILLMCFQSKIVKLKVSKKPDKRNEDLLGNDSKDSSNGGLWNSITSTITGNLM